jgi:pyruvate dehydrogenase kinase 2/3/4
VHDYNERFTKVLSNIKRRHDPVVTTIAQGILEFKRESKSKQIDRSIQTFLDRFYMSRIGEFPFFGGEIAALMGGGRQGFEY